jgi:hypothetical protein
LNYQTSLPPHNPCHILEAADGSNDDKQPVDDLEDHKAPQESAEAELSTEFCLLSEIVLTMNLIEWLSNDWTLPIYVFFRRTP